jgi:hypothetical protein
MKKNKAKNNVKKQDKRISFCFQGFISRASIKYVYDVYNSKEVDVNTLSDKELKEGLETSTYTIDFSQLLNEGNYSKINIELHDFDVA